MRHFLSIFLLGSALLAGGCASTPPPVNSVTPKTAERATETALAMVGKPYRYGGSSPKGFDCSGLVHYSYARAGVRLPRDTSGLRDVSRPITLRQAQRGDLLFFNEEGKRSSHVALYLGGSRFVHAPSGGKHVHVADMSNGYWQRSFAEARRIAVD